MKQFRLILIIFLTGFLQTAIAQEVLSLQEAITIALKNNYEIKLVNNDVTIAENNVNPGNAGFLPAVSASYSNGGSRQNTEQTTNTGDVRKNNNVRNTNNSYGVALGWTIFDGFGMFATYERLKELEKLGKVNAKTTVLSTIAQVINAYYDLSKQQKLVVATDSALDISRFRVNIAKNKLAIGKGSKLDVLAATVDYNTDTSAYLQQLNQVKQSMVNLNQIMARELDREMVVEKEVNIDQALNYTQLQDATLELNPELQNAVISKRIAELQLKEVKSQRYPVIGVNGGYEFSNSANPTGFNQQFKGRGFTYGVTASVNLFNGFLQRQNERNAKVAINSSELSLERAQQTITAELLRAYRNYQTNLELLKVEQGNVEIARQNLDITLERYRLGNIAPLELREAQRNSIQAITRFLDVQHQAKITEITLKEISGTLNFQ